MEIPNFPAQPAHVLMHMAIFKHPGTARNYLSHLKKAHAMLNHTCDFDTLAVRTVIQGIGKSDNFVPIVRKRIRIKTLTKIVRRLKFKGLHQMADICVLSYWFMLRVPSECFGMQRNGKHSKYEVNLDNSVTLHLYKRKNCPFGASLTRSCCCKKLGKDMCPHAVLSKYVPVRQGAQCLFQVTYEWFLRNLRAVLAELGVNESKKFGSHAFRRGCADDMRESKAPLRDILEAGGWRSAAFLLYLDREEVQKDAVAQVAADFSSDEDE